MSLTNPDKTVTEERLSEFYGQILPYLGGMPELLGNKISRSDLYSTSEKIIGQWTDGKPVYQKVVNIGALPTKTTKTSKVVSLGVSVDTIVEVQGYIRSTTWCTCGMWTNGTDDCYIVPSAWNNTDSNYPNKVGFDYCGGNTGSWVSDSYIIVKYTKTTDSAQAIGVDTDYSTTEKIVGTWIDGKPIYQKTFNIGNGNNSTKYITHGISNLGRVINITANAMNNDGTNRWILPYSTNEMGVNIYVTATQIALQCTNYNGSDANFITTVQYTKTTD